MNKILIVGLLIMSSPLLGALQYTGKSFTPKVNVTPISKFNIPTNYKFNQSITPAITTYRNISFNQQLMGIYKPIDTNQPNIEQARQLVEQAKPTTSVMMKKYAAARSYSTQQNGSWWNRLLLWLGIGTAVGIAASNSAQAAEENDEDILRKKYQAPAELAAILDASYEEIEKCLERNTVCKCPNNLPCYIKKGTIINPITIRIKNLEKLRTLIIQENLDEFVLPEKYIWQDYLVAEILTPIKSKNNYRTLNNITKKQLAQLITLAEKGRFWDFIGGGSAVNPNVYMTQDRPGKKFWIKHTNQSQQDNPKKIAIIDTKYLDSGKFRASDTMPLWKSLTIEKASPCDSYDIFMDYKSFSGTQAKHPKFDQFWNKWQRCFKSP